MKKIILLIIVCFTFGAALAPCATADLDGFLGNLNVRAGANLPGFKAKVSAQFGIPIPHVQGIIDIVPTPADAFMCFQISLMIGQPPQAVADIFNRHRKKGWGAMAKELGIKPGSAEFHALKRGNFALTGRPQSKNARSQGKNRQESKSKGASRAKGKKKK